MLFVIPAKAGIQERNETILCVYSCVKKNGTLYTGVTNNLVKRVYEHKQGFVEGFSRKYQVHKLVYYETTNDVNSAIHREKCLKKWRRSWKIRLIEENNLLWKDLYNNLLR